MREVVIVPAWQRPDFLYAALIRLAVADDADEVQYRICLDRRYDPQVLNVAERFARRIGWSRVRIIRRGRHRHKGNSYNVLSAYREALAERPAPDLIHLIEEDVLVARDYFTFARSAHALAPDAFCVTGCRCQQFPPDTNPPPQPDALHLHPSFQSLAVSWRPEVLGRVLAHASRTYFMDPAGYCRAMFPHSRINFGHAEQDGLIHRVLEDAGAVTAYPAVPRAYHAGWIGYHRKGTPVTGTLDQRATAILTMTGEEMNRRAASYPDHVTVPLDQRRPPVTRLITWP